MMATVLDVGTIRPRRWPAANDRRPRFAWIVVRRFIEGYATHVLGSTRPHRRRTGQHHGGEAVATRAISMASDGGSPLAYQAVLQRLATGSGSDAATHRCARAVYAFWMSERAQTYRRLQKLEQLQARR